jgi:hypothetical protein
MTAINATVPFCVCRYENGPPRTAGGPFYWSGWREPSLRSSQTPSVQAEQIERPTKERRISRFVGVAGFEPTASSSRSESGRPIHGLERPETGRYALARIPVRPGEFGLIVTQLITQLSVRMTLSASPGISCAAAQTACLWRATSSAPDRRLFRPRDCSDLIADSLARQGLPAGEVGTIPRSRAVAPDG